MSAIAAEGVVDPIVLAAQAVAAGDVPAELDVPGSPRLVFGAGMADRVGQWALPLSARRRALVVTDPGIERAGHAGRVVQSLRSAGFEVAVFRDVIENPTSEVVDRCVEAARAAGADLLVGVGGGSAMDTAKGCNFVLTNGGSMRDYWGKGKATRPMLPLIAAPTTSGTGSECQSYALISDPVTHQKMACGDPKAMAQLAVLDPTLTLTQPARVTCDTGVDALAHALETAVTRARTADSIRLSHVAFTLALGNLGRVLSEPLDLAARGRMQLAAAFAGAAIERSMLGAAHAAANPLTAQFGVVHGQAVGMMLPAVLRFNAEDPEALRGYAQLALASGLGAAQGAAQGADGADERELLAALLDSVERLLGAAGIARTLRVRGIGSHAIPGLAAEAATQWTGRFNPREVGRAEFEGLYAAVAG